MTRATVIEANTPERRAWMIPALSLELAAILFLAIICLCAGCSAAPIPLTSSTAIEALGQGVTAEGRTVGDASKAIQAEVPAIQRVAPEPAGKLSAQAVILDKSAERLAALGAKAEDLALQVEALEKKVAAATATIADLQKQIDKLKDENATRGNIILYGLTAFFILVISVAVFVALRVPTLSTDGWCGAAAAACAAIFCLLLLRYAKPILIGLLVLCGLLALGGIAYLIWALVTGHIKLGRKLDAVISSVEVSTKSGDLIRTTIQDKALAAGIADSLHEDVQRVTSPPTSKA